MSGSQRIDLSNADPQINIRLLHSPYYSLITNHISFKDELALASTSKLAMKQFIAKWSDPVYMLATLGMISPSDYYLFRQNLPSVIADNFQLMFANDNTPENKKNQAYVCWALITNNVNEIDTQQLAASAVIARTACEALPWFPKRVFEIVASNIELLELSREKKQSEGISQTAAKIFFFNTSNKERLQDNEIATLCTNMMYSGFYNILGVTTHRAKLKKKHIDQMGDCSGKYLAGVTLCSTSGVLSPGMDLSNKNFANADLSQAQMQGCVLAFANFTKANLRGANLNGARLQNACFIDADLTDASMLFEKEQGAEIMRPTVVIFAAIFSVAALNFDEARNQARLAMEDRFNGTVYFSSVTDTDQLDKKLNMFSSIKVDRVGKFVKSVINDLLRVVLHDLKIQVIDADRAAALLFYAKQHPFVSGNYFNIDVSAVREVLDNTIKKIQSRNEDVFGDIEMQELHPKIR